MREIVLDTETTGIDPDSGHRIIEIGCVEIINKVQTGKVFHAYINPQRKIDEGSYRVHGLSEEFLSDKPLFVDVAKDFLAFIGNDQLVIHNAGFDKKFINAELTRMQHDLLSNPIVDTIKVAREKLPGAQVSLDALCRRFDISTHRRTKHGALIDSQLLAEVYMELTVGSQTKIFQEGSSPLPQNQEQSQNLTDKNKHMTANSSDESKKSNNGNQSSTQHKYKVIHPSKEHKKQHNEFVDSIKDPIWNKFSLN